MSDDEPNDSPERLDLPERHRRREAAQRWVQVKWTARSKECPICLTTSWTITDVQELRPFSQDTGDDSGSVFPVFLVVCNNCAHAHVFSAVKAGVMHDAAGEP